MDAFALREPLIDWQREVIEPAELHRAGLAIGASLRCAERVTVCDLRCAARAGVEGTGRAAP